jgi:Xaa-Pro aminopeptidase
MRLAASFYRRKLAELQGRLLTAGLDGLLLFRPPNLYYLFGFFFLPTERTVAAWIPAEGESVLFLPKLEADHAAAHPWLGRLEVYFEYLGPPHPVEWIAEQVHRRVRSRPRLGHEGSLGQATLARLQRGLPGAQWSAEGGQLVADMRLVKEPEELALMRQAGVYADFMVECGADLVRQRGSISELEINQTVSQAVTSKMVAELDEVISANGLTGGLVCAGARAAFPHGIPSLARPQPGDCLILSFGCSVGGYHAESERTFFYGEPSAEQQRLYEAVRQAQALGVEQIVAGHPCAEPDRVAQESLAQAGFAAHVRHRLGHGMGLEIHEAPWLEEGDSSGLRPGMVVSAEPGLYLPGQGGYRLSDTLIVGLGRPESVTNFPRELGEVVIPAG